MTLWNHHRCPANLLSIQQIIAASIICLCAASACLGQLCQAPQKLVASDGTTNDRLGVSSAISGDTAVAGAWWDGPGNAAGSVYVFVHDGGVWSQQAKLTAADAGGSDFFGYASAIEGDTIIIGAYGDDVGGAVDAGSAYVFVRTGTTWTQQAKLTASDASADDAFGLSVALSGDKAIIGATLANLGGLAVGAAYVFVRLGTVWTQQAKLTATDAGFADSFGNAVDIVGDTAVIGAVDDDNAGGSNAGGAYIFARSGTTWSQKAKLIASDGAMDDAFGVSVAVSGNTVLVGSISDDHSSLMNAGSVYAFVQSGGAWAQQAKLTASDPGANDQFGDSVALLGNTAVIGVELDDNAAGMNAGAAYVFMRSNGVWTQQAKIVAPDAAVNDQFGTSVALSGDSVIVGSQFDNIGGVSDAGSAFIFQCSILPTCPADATGNGTVDIDDLMAVISDWGPCVRCTADVTGDGVVSSDDLVAVINAWGSCS